MSKLACLLLLIAASAQIAEASPGVERRSLQEASATPTPASVPTVTLLRGTPVSIPTVTVRQPIPTPTATPKPKPRPKRTVKHPAVQQPSGTWIWAYLTSYCPGSAGWLSSSGMPVFYGMLANNFYRFGTRVYLPVLGIVGVVEDHLGGYPAWNHFDVWSPVCYGTPTGYFRVEVLR
jgi:hypothetical protein